MPGTRVAEAGLERGVARDVVAGRALGQAAADDDVLDLGGIDAGARSTAWRSTCAVIGMPWVWLSAPRPARDAGPTVGDDGDVLHASTSIDWTAGLGLAV